MRNFIFVMKVLFFKIGLLFPAVKNVDYRETVYVKHNRSTWSLIALLLLVSLSDKPPLFKHLMYKRNRFEMNKKQCSVRGLSITLACLIT